MSLRASLVALLLLTVACGAPGQRAEYAPVGLLAQDSLTEWTEEGPLAAFAVRCQGRYFNEVDGDRVATVHLQLLATRTSSLPMTVPLEDLRLTLERPDEPPLELRPAQAWSGQEPLPERLTVPAWSRRVTDLFFDEPDDEGPEPLALRLRFVHVELDELERPLRRHHECQFFLLDEDDPRRGAAHAVDDRSFGYRDGHYFPGQGELGPRRLRDTDEVRLFYVFHEP